MKRLIILLLLLSCFRFSYAQELTAEQQQLAWKFIQENLLYKDLRPNMFNSDIRINLIGEITSADSSTVKDLLPSIQKSIPNLTIQLTDKPGNFVFEVKQNKEIRINTSVTTDKGIIKYEFKHLESVLTDPCVVEQTKQQ